MATRALLDAPRAPRAAGRLALLPPPPLFDARGLRLTLEAAARLAAEQPVGSLQFAAELLA